MNKYEKIYNETDKIIGSPYYDLGAIIGRTKEVGKEELENLNEYSKQFLSVEDRGVLRTILIVLKPYRDNDIIKDTFKLLSDKLRSGSKNGII